MSQGNNQKKGLSPALKNFFGVGDAGFVLMSNVETFYFMNFLTNIAAFSPAVAGVINSVFSIVERNSASPSDRCGSASRNALPISSFHSFNSICYLLVFLITVPKGFGDSFVFQFQYLYPQVFPQRFYYLPDHPS